MRHVWLCFFPQPIVISVYSKWSISLKHTLCTFEDRILILKFCKYCNYDGILVTFKGGYLDFSLLTELEKIYIAEIYIKKQYKSLITKNHKIKQKKISDGVPLKGYVASEVIFRFCARNRKKALWENQVTNDA